MIEKKYIVYLLVLILVDMLSCKKPYAPTIITSGTSHLVVEGMINTGADTTSIRLTRTIPLSAPSDSIAPVETGATVVIQSDANASYPLSETGNGYYMAAGLNLNPSNKYRLQIRTADNKIYQSDFVAAKNSPPVDSVSFTAQNTGVQVNVSTHDLSNGTRYYRYDYQETWIIHADYQSLLKVVKTTDIYGNTIDTIVLRDYAHEIYTCWTSDVSSDIILASTDKLSKDVLANSPVTFVDSHSEKLGTRYSILVRQYALTKDAFEYYQQLSKNTQKLGGIFDPQPSSLTGNIHSLTNPAEQVIGFITAGSVAQKRFYIDRSALPAGSQYITSLPFENCRLYSFLFSNPTNGKNDVDLNIYHGDAIPISPIGLPGQPPKGYFASGGICVDCTLRGTNVRPAFWTDQY